MVDIVELNVGGVNMTVHRKTLLQAPEDSLLHAMFSGRWDGAHEFDQRGFIFLDFSPHCFGIIVDFLRTLSITSSPLKPPIVAPERLQTYSALVEYLGLCNCLHGCLSPLRMRSDQDCVRVESMLDGCRLLGGGERVGATVLSNVRTVWKVVVHALMDHVRLGVCTLLENESRPKEKEGWRLHGGACHCDDDGEQWQNIDDGGAHFLFQLAQCVHTAEQLPSTRQLRPRNLQLTILTGSGVCRQLSLPSDHWHVWVVIEISGGSRDDYNVVTICPATPADAARFEVVESRIKARVQAQQDDSP